MKIHWSGQSEGKGTRYTARVGSIHASFYRDSDGNTPYSLYTMINGRRMVILSVGNNRGKHAINARVRLDFLMTCLDNNLSFDLLPNENPEHKDVTYRPEIIPKPPVSANIDGLYMGRLYRHHSGRLYRVLMVTNRLEDGSHPDMPKTVCFRDIDSGAEWSRPFVQFTPEKFQLVPYGEKRVTNIDFKAKTFVKEQTINV